jgi:hypothetical protein
MMEIQTVIENLRPLTQEQRQDARHAAQDAVMRAVGARPSRDQFTWFYRFLRSFDPPITVKIFLAVRLFGRHPIRKTETIYHLTAE